jgi:hypothetical protein
MRYVLCKIAMCIGCLFGAYFEKWYPWPSFSSAAMTTITGGLGFAACAAHWDRCLQWEGRILAAQTRLRAPKTLCIPLALPDAVGAVEGYAMVYKSSAQFGSVLDLQGHPSVSSD